MISRPYMRIILVISAMTIAALFASLAIAVVRDNAPGAATSGVLLGLFLDSGARDLGRWLRERRK